MAASEGGGDKYRSYLTPEDLSTTQWLAGPPNYDVVNKLFEEGRTRVWAAGSLEEYVQNLVKTWEMELVHKANPDQYKTLDPKSFTIGINGKRYFTLPEVGEVGGSYNVFLQTSLPQELRFYDPERETYDSSQTTFKQVFPRGFALEIVQVYSGPPVIAYKFRHWGYFEGAFKDNAPTGDLVEMFGIGVFELNEEAKVVKVEFFLDRGELLAGLINPRAASGESTQAAPASACPFMA